MYIFNIWFWNAEISILKLVLQLALLNTNIN